MRRLRLTLEETIGDRIYRAERVITGTELKSYRHFKDTLALHFSDLQKTLDTEIKEHERAATAESL